MGVTGIILAGGKSSRMGSDKGLLEFNDKPMIQTIIDALSALDIPIFIVSNNDEYKQFGLPVIEDVVKDKGPVAGIYTGLLNSKTELNIILSCDIPLISTETLSFLLNNVKDFDVTIPKMNNTIHPLIGVYTKSSLKTFKNHLDKDQRKLIKVCNDLNTQIIDITKNATLGNERLFSNINTPEELEKLSI